MWPLTKATAILDSGCGSGVATAALISSYGDSLPPNARVIAADFSSSSVDAVRKQRELELAKGNVAWERVETAVLDAQDLSSLRDAELSHMMAGFMLFMVPNPAAALREAFRVLAPSGVLSHTCWRGSEWLDMLQMIKEVKPDAELFTMPEAWTSTEGVKHVMTEAGFTEVEAQEVETYMEVKDPAYTVDILVRKMPTLAATRATMTEEEVDKVCGSMEDFLKAKFPVLPGKMKGVAILGVGRK